MQCKINISSRVAFSSLYVQRVELVEMRTRKILSILVVFREEMQFMNSSSMPNSARVLYKTRKPSKDERLHAR